MRTLSLTPYTKINSKCFTDLNVRHDTIKLLEGNISETFFNINYSNIFLMSQDKRNKSKNKKWDPIKLLCFCTAKETINKTKKHPIWEKIFANDVTNKGFISKI